MTSGYEPVLYALDVEPRIARPGQTVRITFQTRNFAGVASPSGVVRFVLPSGLDAAGNDAARHETGGHRDESATATVAVAAAAPGEDVVAEIRARVAGPMDDGTRLDVQAVLEIENRSFGTNVCTVVVRSRPVLDGAGSGTFVEALDDQTARVWAVVTNEGDGPACNVRIVVPVPIGTVAIQPEVDEPSEPPARTLDVARLDAGERVVVAFDARIVARAGVLCVDDASIVFADGRHCAIPARAEIVVKPHVAPPEVVVTPGRRRIDVGVNLCNDGWADARDVRVEVTLPETLRLREGSITVDGVPVPARSASRKNAESLFARLEKNAGLVVVVIDRIAARSAAHVALTAILCAGGAACVAGEILVKSGSGEVAIAPFAIEAVRDVRARVVGSPRRVTPGDIVALVIEVRNLGDSAESLTLDARPQAAETVVLPALEAGRVAVATLVVRVPLSAGTPGVVPLEVLVSDAEGVRARATHTIVARNRVYAADTAPRIPDLLESQAAMLDDSRAAIAMHGCALSPIPGDAAPIHDHAASSHDHAASSHDHAASSHDHAASSHDRAASIEGWLSAPAAVVAGTAFTVTGRLDVGCPLESIVLRMADIDRATYVPGSARLDGCAVLDRDGTSAFAGAGLTLRGVPSGTRATLQWTMLARCDGGTQPICIAACALTRDATVELTPAIVQVHAGDAFAVRPATLPYHVDAVIAGPADDAHDVPISSSAAVAARTADIAEQEVIARYPAAPPALPHRPAAPAAPEWTLQLDAARADAIARALRDTVPNTLAAHIAGLRALLPDLDDTHGVAVACALADACEAARNVLEHLAVKLRIPGFEITSADLEDASLRDSLVALSRRCSRPEEGSGAHPAEAATGAGADDGACLFAETGLGSPAALRALVALVPGRCNENPRLAAALRRYANLLDDLLENLSASAPLLFDMSLEHDAGFALADARAAVAAEALPRPSLAGAA